MRYFQVEPEVAGGVGENTSLNNKVHPPIVYNLHYQFDGWDGDALLEGFPCFIATDDLSKAIMEARLTGVTFAPLEVSTSYEFQELYPGRKLPRFRWMQVHGRAGVDDFGRSNKLYLVVSERAIDLVRRFGFDNAEIEDYVS
jgi:hypothetical protein